MVLVGGFDPLEKRKDRKVDIVDGKATGLTDITDIGIFHCLLDHHLFFEGVFQWEVIII